MSRHRWHAPLDPECPEVVLYYEGLSDIRAFGAPVEDFVEDFERSHRANCVRCQEYGVANIEIE